MATRQRQEPSPLDAVSRRERAPDRLARRARSARSARSSRARARRRCARRRRARTCRCRPRSRTSPCRRRRPTWPSATAPPRAPSSACGDQRLVGLGALAHVAPGRRVALADDGDDHVVAPDARLARRQHARRARIDGADVGRGREEDGRLLVAPFLDRVRARQLARAVERRRRAEVRGVPGIARVRPDRRHAGVVGHAHWRGRRARRRTSVIAFAAPVGSCPTTNP